MLIEEKVFFVFQIKYEKYNPSNIANEKRVKIYGSCGLPEDTRNGKRKNNRLKKI